MAAQSFDTTASSPATWLNGEGDADVQAEVPSPVTPDEVLFPSQQLARSNNVFDQMTTDYRLTQPGGSGMTTLIVHGGTTTIINSSSQPIGYLSLYVFRD